MTSLATFEIKDHLAHAWRDELVGFALDPALAAQPLQVRDDSGTLTAHQVGGAADQPRVFFRVDELPALGVRSYTLEAADVGASPAVQPCVAQPDGDAVILGNGRVSVRVPAARQAVTQFPAPLLAVRRGTGAWLGAGRLYLSDFLAPQEVTSAVLERGQLWLTWRVGYRCQGGERYTVDLKLFADRPFVEITETSELGRDARWEFSLKPGLAPDHTWTHPHQVRGDEGRLCAIPFADAHHRHDVGSIQLPIYSGIWVSDDYYYCAFLNPAGSPDCIAAAGVNGGFWDYPYENQIDVCFSAERDAFFRGAIKAGHRRWLLLAVDRDEVTGARPFFTSSIHQAIKRYETPLDKVKDYVLDWDDAPAAQRPFLLADRKQLRHSQKLARDYQPLADYVAALNPDLPGDYTYYHSGTHRTFEPDYRNDPAVCYVTARTQRERRRQARFLKDVVLNGLANRRGGMLDHVGHCDSESCSINLGRGLRPWAALYDFAAAEDAFTAAEHRLVKATFAFYCYKINDPDYWPAEHLILRDDHPRSAHRTHWFPWRHSDWAFYNIDNIPHNFHGDLWSACGCVAMAFPGHPASRGWVNRTLEFWEAELTEWVFPEGAWLESTTYTLNSMKDYLVYCRALANARIRDYFTDERLQRVFRFYAETLLPYDERIGGASFPVLGDASYPNGFGYVIGWIAGLAAADRSFSRTMNAVWRQTGEYLTEPGRFGLNFCDFLFINPFIPSGPLPPPRTKRYPGLGALLRHATGGEGDIYAFIKGGIIYSHFHEPEGTFQLWWDGVPLCDEYGVQYGKGTSDMAQHNCVEVRGGAWSCYNKGDVTRLLATPAFDFVTVDAPILQAYLQEGQGMWGFRGEMGPAGWHRRHVLLVKPYYLLICDDIESVHPTTYHLNVKADAVSQDGGQVHYDGRLGVDLEFLALGPGRRVIRHSEFDVEPTSKYGFQPPPRFFHQFQLHIDGEPNQGYTTLLAPHRPTTPVAVAEDVETGGARLRIGDADVRAWLLPRSRRLRTPQIEHDGACGAVHAAGGELILHQVLGTRIGVPGKLLVSGDGPVTATLATDGSLRLHTDGVGRWLTLAGRPWTTATTAGRRVPLETTADGVRVHVAPGPQDIVLT